MPITIFAIDRHSMPETPPKTLTCINPVRKSIGDVVEAQRPDPDRVPPIDALNG
jgi:hypothetical protein